MSNFRINEATVKKYHQDGYILFDEPLFAPEKFERLFDRQATLGEAIG